MAPCIPSSYILENLIHNWASLGKSDGSLPQELSGQTQGLMNQKARQTMLGSELVQQEGNQVTHREQR